MRELCARFRSAGSSSNRSEEHTSELQSQSNLVCRLLLEKKQQHHVPYPSNAAMNESLPAPHTPLFPSSSTLTFDPAFPRAPPFQPCAVTTMLGDTHMALG